MTHVPTPSAPTDQTAYAERYSNVAIALHWSIAALVLTTLPLGLFGAANDNPAGQMATDIHKPIGILILALTLVRIGWRLTHRPPPLSDAYATHLKWIARVAHVLFYVLLLLLPLSGWWMSSAVPIERHPINVAGLEIPFLPVPRGWPSAGPARMMHGNMGWLMIGLVVLHVLAALRHQFIDKDNILARMTPPAVSGKFSNLLKTPNRDS